MAGRALPAGYRALGPAPQMALPWGRWTRVIDGWEVAGDARGRVLGVCPAAGLEGLGGGGERLPTMPIEHSPRMEGREGACRNPRDHASHALSFPHSLSQAVAQPIRSPPQPKAKGPSSSCADRSCQPGPSWPGARFPQDEMSSACLGASPLSGSFRAAV